jgi:hypothetical protein
MRKADEVVPAPATNQNRRCLATRAALGSQYILRRIQRRFGRTIQSCGVTKLGCRNGAATWAECSGRGVRSRRVFWASQSFGLRRQDSWLKVWRGDGCNFSATERAHKRNGGQVSRKVGSRVWSRRRCNEKEPTVFKLHGSSQSYARRGNTI